jgi:hypothetical protein
VFFSLTELEVCFPFSVTDGPGGPSYVFFSLTELEVCFPFSVTDGAGGPSYVFFSLTELEVCFPFSVSDGPGGPSYVLLVWLALWVFFACFLGGCVAVVFLAFFGHGRTWRSVLRVVIRVIHVVSCLARVRIVAGRLRW